MMFGRNRRERRQQRHERRMQKREHRQQRRLVRKGARASVNSKSGFRSKFSHRKRMGGGCLLPVALSLLLPALILLFAI